METKKCRDCGEEKALEENFYKKSGRINQWMPYCKPCHLARNNKARDLNANTKERTKKNYQDWYSKNKRAKIEYNIAYAKKKWNNDPAWRLRRLVSGAVYNALKANDGGKNGGSILDYLPYSINELKEHLEKQFEPWMSWDNHGEWHIDHIYPQSKLPFDSLEHPNFQKCWALENLRPLCAIKNMKKKDKTLDFQI